MLQSAALQTKSTGTTATYEKHAVGNLVLADTPAENDHAGFLDFEGHVVETSDVRHEVDNERHFGFVGMCPEHVTETAVGQSRTENGNVVLREIDINIFCLMSE